MPTHDNDVERAPGAEQSRHRFSWIGYESPSTAVVEAVAEVTGKRTDELAVLNDTVDCDALDTVLSEASSLVELSFTYGGAHVTVTSAGSILVWTDH